jgi:hypothetical protein
MAKRYASFLIRWWRLGGDQQRVEIEHIQTGERTLFESLRAAFAWIAAGGAAPARTPDPAPDRTEPALGGDVDEVPPR